MKLKQMLILGLSCAAVMSCTSTKKLKESEKKYSKLDSAYTVLKNTSDQCQTERATDKATIKSLQDELSYAKANNTQVLNQLKDMSVITGTQAESIKKSMENIGVKDEYITELQKAMNRKDSMNIALMVNLKSAIGDLSDDDINIKVDKDVVYVDISDKLLFKSGSYIVTDRAKEVLGKVAKVLLSRPDIDFMVEGHTDNKPFKRGELEDNWDLSTKRATSVIRILQNTYHVPPEHITAAGRSEYQPIASNDTKEGRAINRRTRIVILPQLDQFYKILEKPGK